MQLTFTCIADLQCRVGEGPVYDERSDTLFFVDILSRRLYAMTLDTEALRSWNFETEVASLGLAASGRLVVALRHEVVLFDPATEQKTVLCTVEAERGDEIRLNDGKVGPDGCFWVGSMDDRADKQPVAALYRVEPSGRVEKKVDGITISNGLAWTAGGETMFHSDTRGPWIDRWNFDRWSGEISGRSRIAEPGEDAGRPDGGAVDAEGFYWSAGVSAGRLNRFSPDGRLAEAHHLPVGAPTMPCFGGADFRTIFLTSLREGKAPETLQRWPQSGGLFRAESPVSGLPAWRFLDA